jgi:AraC family transcriptional activator of pobA
VIRARIVAEARRRLLHSADAVSAIGETLGFDDPAYFSRFFRRETGTSPEAFRHSIREKYQSRRA